MNYIITSFEGVLLSFLSIATLDTFLSVTPSLQLCVVLEYCSEGDLDHYIKKMLLGSAPPQFPSRLDMIGQLTRGIEYLHTQVNMIHRDLKPANVLVKPGPVLKISDFGLAKTLTQSSRAYTKVGTPYYMAPEVMMYQPHGRPADIFSLGALFDILIIGRVFMTYSLSVHSSIF